MTDTRQLLHDAEALQDLLVSHATGGNGDDEEYQRLRRSLLNQPALTPLIPEFLRDSRDLVKHFLPQRPQNTARTLPSKGDRGRFADSEPPSTVFTSGVSRDAADFAVGLELGRAP